MSYYIETNGKAKGTWEVLRHNVALIRVGEQAAEELQLKRPERKLKIFTDALQGFIELDEYLSDHGVAAFAEERVALKIYGDKIAPVIGLCRTLPANQELPGTDVSFQDFFTRKASEDFYKIVDRLVSDFNILESKRIIEVPIARVDGLLALTLRQFDDLSEDELYRLLQHVPQYLWFNLMRRYGPTVFAGIGRIDADRYLHASPDMDVALTSQLQFRHKKVVAWPIVTNLHIPEFEKERYAEVKNWRIVYRRRWTGPGEISFLNELALLEDLVFLAFDRSGLQMPMPQRVLTRIKNLTGDAYAPVVEFANAQPPYSLHRRVPFETLQKFFVDVLHGWYMKWLGCVTLNADKSVTIRLPQQAPPVLIPAKRRAIDYVP